MPGLRETLDRWVYTSLGADALAFVGAHPWLYQAVAGLLALAAILLAWWGARRLGRLRQELRVALALVLSAEGRRCLASARAIRRGAARLRHSIRREIQDRDERKALLGLLDRFTRSELHNVLEHARWLIRTADDARERGLRQELEWQTRAWNESKDDAERARLQQAVARTRQQLARIAPVNAARRQHVLALAEAAEAVQTLEAELATLGQTRGRALPDFRDQLGQAAQHLADLREAYRQLEHTP